MDASESERDSDADMDDVASMELGADEGACSEDGVSLHSEELDIAQELLEAEQLEEAGSAPAVVAAPPLPPPPPPPAPELAIPHPPAIEFEEVAPPARASRNPADIVIGVRGSGVLRFYSNKRQIVAQCLSRGHGPNCFLTRTIEPSGSPAYAAQGRPMGFMLAWLAEAPPAISRFDHVHLFKPSYEVRARHRERGMLQAAELPNLGDLFAKERPPRQHLGEGDEPRGCP